ncbi:MAG TPA: transglutaminase domain-containing protein [Aequorivita sp.]|nr:transglutaminase domain-containing protein [Aequorivita sp.]
MKTRVLLIVFLLVISDSFGQDYRFKKVSKEELLQKEHPVDSDANAAILYREVKTEFQYSEDSGWYLVTDYFERIKIYNKGGFDRANLTIDLYKGAGEDNLKGLRGYTYYIDSKGKMKSMKLQKEGIFTQETTKYLTQTKVTMPDLREGCIVEYKYTINSPFIFNIDEFRLQENIPVDKVSIVFRSPEYFQYKTHQRGWVPYNVETTTKERTMTISNTARDSDMRMKTSMHDVNFKEQTHEINLDGVSALKEEPYAGNINNYTTALQFELSYVDIPGGGIKTYSTTWEDVSKSIYKVDSFGPELERSNYFAKDIDELLTGANSPQERVGRIFFYVLNKMNWNNYTGYYTNEGVRSAYKKGIGNVADINLMLVSMLRYANIEANPVLVSTKSHGMPLFPTINGFNYVIAAVEFPEGTLLLDATNKHADLGVLKPEIINGKGRVLRENGQSSWISLRSMISAVKSSMLSLEINSDLSLKGKANNRFTGNYAFQYRSIFKNLNNDAQRKKIEESTNQTELSHLKFENLNVLGEPVALEYNFESFDYIEEVAGKLYFSPLVFLANYENPFKPETREYPIDFGFPMKDRYIVNVTLPEGYVVESIPEDVVYNLGENTGSYRYLISQIGDRLQLSVEFSINQSFIAAEEYGNLKKFFELCIAKEKEKVVLSKA